MTTFILGAGASLHAGYPLASNLGEEIERWLTREIATPAGQLYGETLRSLRKLYGNLTNLEQILSELDESPPGCRAGSWADTERKHAYRAIRILIPEFFRHIRNDTASLYGELARSVIRRGDCVITFNYDTALERELKRAGLWEIGDGYGFSLAISSIPASPIRVLKLHGSVNWVQPAFGGMTGFFQGGPTAFGDRPVIMPTEFGHMGYAAELRDPLTPAGTFGGLPAIITPTLNKRFYDRTSGGIEMAGFWDGLWNIAGVELASAERIVVVGYSMPLADKRARDLLLVAPNPARLCTFTVGQILSA